MSFDTITHLIQWHICMYKFVIKAIHVYTKYQISPKFILCQCLQIGIRFCITGLIQIFFVILSEFWRCGQKYLKETFMEITLIRTVLLHTYHHLTITLPFHIKHSWKWICFKYDTVNAILCDHVCLFFNQTFYRWTLANGSILVSKYVS